MNNNIEFPFVDDSGLNSSEMSFEKMFADSDVESGIDLAYSLDDHFMLQSVFDGDLGGSDGAGVANECDSFYQLKSKPVSESPPTPIKMATMTSRTQLKQLLQLQQTRDEEWKKGGRSPTGPGIVAPPVSYGGGGGLATVAVNVPQTSAAPAASSRVGLPSDVLKFQSKLQHPTKYHIVASTKRQVHDYLSTAQGNAVSLLVQSVPGGAEGGVISSMATSTTTAGSSAPNFSSSGVPSPTSPGDGLSSSAATSVSGVDGVELDIEELMRMEEETNALQHQPSTLPMTDTNFLEMFDMSVEGVTAKSCPPQVSGDKRDSGYSGGGHHGQLHAVAKDRQKKDNHNMIERRRRYNINDRIQELGTLLPKSSDPLYDRIRPERQNKGTILRATCSYIRELKMQVARTEQEAQELRSRNKQLLNFCSQNKQAIVGAAVEQVVTVGGNVDLTMLLNGAFSGEQHVQQPPTVRIKQEEPDPGSAYCSPSSVHCYASPQHSSMMSPGPQLDIDDDHRDVISTVGGDPMLNSLMSHDDDDIIGMDYIS